MHFRLNKIIFILAIGFLLNSCIGEANQKPQVNAMNDSKSFIGLWQSTPRAYPYKSFLVIKADSTFHYQYGACLAFGFSDGKWKIEENILVLNSNKTDSCMYLKHFGKDCIIINDSVLDSDFNIDMTIRNCNPSSDINYVNFTNARFLFNLDTLKHIITVSDINSVNNFIKK